MYLIKAEDGEFICATPTLDIRDVEANLDVWSQLNNVLIKVLKISKNQIEVETRDEYDDWEPRQETFLVEDLDYMYH